MRFTDAKKGDFNKWIQKESWEDLYKCDSLADEITKIVFNKLDKIFPEEKI